MSYSISEFLFWEKRHRRRWKRVALAERHFFRALLDLTENDYAIDCGANTGTFTRHLARTGCKVYAFEPDPVPFSILSKHLSNLPNVHLYRKAVANRNGTARLGRSDGFSDNPIDRSVESSLFVPDTGDGIDVDLVNLAELIQKQTKPPRLLKMDIEGSEIEVLQSLIENNLLSQIQHVFVETHEQIFKHLRRTTYELIQRCQAPELRHINFDWD